MYIQFLPARRQCAVKCGITGVYRRAVTGGRDFVMVRFRKGFIKVTFEVDLERSGGFGSLRISLENGKARVSR